MNSSIIGITAQGTLHLEMGLPLRPSADVIIHHAHLEDGALLLTFTPDAKLRAELFQRDGNTLSQIMNVGSCPIEYSETNALRTAIAWSRPNDMTMVVNGTIVGTTKQDAKLPDSIVIRPKTGGTAIDFSERSAAAKTKRKGKAAGTHPVPGRRPRTLERDLLDLRHEAIQIIDLVSLVRTGRTHHALGIARSLRKLLIGTKGKMGVLQRCAGRLDVPLTMYTVAEPARELAVVHKPTHSLEVEMHGIPDGPFSNPVDVDVWLDLQGGKLGGKVLTNRDIIIAIGHTEAAHGDADMHPVVEMLESIGTGLSTDKRLQDFLVYYVWRLGDTIAHVADRVLKSAPHG